MNVEGRNQKNSLGSRQSMQGNIWSTPALKEETFNPLTLCSRGLSCCSQCTQVWHTEASQAMHQTMHQTFCAHLLQPVPPCPRWDALCPTNFYNLCHLVHVGMHSALQTFTTCATLSMWRCTLPYTPFTTCTTLSLWGCTLPYTPFTTCATLSMWGCTLPL